MRVIKAGYEILSEINGTNILKSIESIGRVCYKSEEKITKDSSEKFVANLLRRGHESVIEHEKITVKFICDRGVSHELVRHRIASFSQESTRYCNYANEKFGKELTVIKPLFWDEASEQYKYWLKIMKSVEQTYNSLVESGAKAEEARCILPNSLKTEIVVSMNLREWRHFFKLRTATAAHPQMREITIPLLRELNNKIPIVFNDIIID